jgi:phage recombination protein Bet
MSTTALQTANAGQVSLVKKLAQLYGVEDSKFYNMIITTVFPSKLKDKPFVPTAEMVMAFLIVCEQYDLNPILREIYPFIDSNGNLRVIVGIDGWIKQVQRQPEFDGHEFIDHLDADKRVYATTCKIYRTDRTRPGEMTEYLSECKRDTEPWNKWPTRMLKHKAFIQASRYAFGMAGVEDEDDYERSIIVRPEPTGAIQLEPGSPLLTTAKPTDVPPPGIFVQVGKSLTVITGQTYDIREDLPKVGAKWDGKARVWTMPAARTHELLAICEAKHVGVTEFDDNGKPLAAAPPALEPGDDSESQLRFEG